MVVCLALVIVLVPVNPVMVVEGSNDGEVLVDTDQEGRQQGGRGHQGGACCQKTAECWKKQVLEGLCKVLSSLVLKSNGHKIQTWTRLNDLEG